MRYLRPGSTNVRQQHMIDTNERQSVDRLGRLPAGLAIVLGASKPVTGYPHSGIAASTMSYLPTLLHSTSAVRESPSRAVRHSSWRCPNAGWTAPLCTQLVPVCRDLLADSGGDLCWGHLCPRVSFFQSQNDPGQCMLHNGMHGGAKSLNCHCHDCSLIGHLCETGSCVHTDRQAIKALVTAWRSMWTQAPGSHKCPVRLQSAC